MINLLKMRKVLKKIVKNNSILYRLHLWFSKDRKQGQSLSLIYNPLDLNTEYYEKIKDLNRDFEHQIGRLSNFKKIIEVCQSLEGDFIEFGSWQGFSLLWIAYFMERNAIFTKKLIGLDGFVGLPYTDGIFDKFAFSDTSLKLCRKNLLENRILYDETKRNIFIEKFLYKQKESILQFLKKKEIEKFCFIHIDCDVSRSAEEIFEILLDGKYLADKCYILFDDYGCESGLRQTIDGILKRLEENWQIETHSGTKLTKNFILDRRK